MRAKTWATVSLVGGTISSLRSYRMDLCRQRTKRLLTCERGTAASCRPRDHTCFQGPHPELKTLRVMRRCHLHRDACAVNGLEPLHLYPRHMHASRTALSSSTASRPVSLSHHCGTGPVGAGRGYQYLTSIAANAVAVQARPDSTSCRIGLVTMEARPCTPDYHDQLTQTHGSMAGVCIWERANIALSRRAGCLKLPVTCWDGWVR